MKPGENFKKQFVLSQSVKTGFLGENCIVNVQRPLAEWSFGISELPFFCQFLQISRKFGISEFFAGARQRPRGHLVPRILQQPYLSGFLSLLYHFMNSAMPSCRLCKLPHNLNLMLLLCALPQKFCFFF